MPDLDPRAERVKAIAESLFGKVLDRDGDTMRVEIPADMCGPAASSFGQGGFSAVIVGQNVRQAPKRIINMEYQTIVIDELATTAFYIFKIELADRHAKVDNLPHAAAIAITRPTKRSSMLLASRTRNDDLLEK